MVMLRRPTTAGPVPKAAESDAYHKSKNNDQELVSHRYNFIHNDYEGVHCAP